MSASPIYPPPPPQNPQNNAYYNGQPQMPYQYYSSPPVQQYNTQPQPPRSDIITVDPNATYVLPFQTEEKGPGNTISRRTKKFLIVLVLLIIAAVLIYVFRSQLEPVGAILVKVWIYFLLGCCAIVAIIIWCNYQGSPEQLSREAQHNQDAQIAAVIEQQRIQREQRGY